VPLHACRPPFGVLTSLSSTVQANLPDLRDVLFFGNPIYENLSRQEQRIEVLKKLPNLQKIDGDMVKPAEREEAAAADE
jgi:dynein light chain 1